MASNPVAEQLNILGENLRGIGQDRSAYRLGMAELGIKQAQQNRENWLDTRAPLRQLVTMQPGLTEEQKAEVAKSPWLEQKVNGIAIGDIPTTAREMGKIQEMVFGEIGAENRFGREMKAADTRFTQSETRESRQAAERLALEKQTAADQAARNVAQFGQAQTEAIMRFRQGLTADLAKTYTPESVNRFNMSGDYGALVPMPPTDLEKAQADYYRAGAGLRGVQANPGALGKTSEVQDAWNKHLQSTEKRLMAEAAEGFSDEIPKIEDVHAEALRTWPMYYPGVQPPGTEAAPSAGSGISVPGGMTLMPGAGGGSPPWKQFLKK